MNVNILDKKDLGTKSWYLCKCNLYDYLLNLNKDFYNFQIQRRIVKNIYLDGICNTILSGEPIPPFTITVDNIGSYTTDDVLDIDLAKCEILDGLQRTFRLWALLDFQKIIKENNLQNPKDFIRHMKTQGEFGDMILGLDFISASFLKLLFEESSYNGIIEAFKRFDIMLVIWVGLTQEEVVKKMLLLNAGQRPVSSTHQYELLFLHVFDNSKISVPNVKLFRERDSRYFAVRRGERSIGEYTMSSVIISLQSLIEKKPLRVIPANYIQWDTDTILDFETLNFYFNSEFISRFLACIYEMDAILSQRDVAYIKWFGKDTTLSGIFAGIGMAFSSDGDTIQYCEGIVSQLRDGELDFALDDFNKAYDALASTRVNVGNVVRRAISEYTYELILKGKASWDYSFKQIYMR